ncbi:MAG TPA: metallophosphoesterase [Candidatus Latescibacteria bacterium]|nr:metallophosphoesterase [Candidatus Latescibacterota bacterium]
MHYAIISDIHGNLQALRAALEVLEQKSIDQYVCLGDIVGYGANPNECVHLIRTLTDKVLIGNHDHAALGLTDIDYFNPYAREAVVWTAEQLSPESKDFLGRLPFKLERGGYLFVHSTPGRPEQWRYILSPYQALEAFDEFGGVVCFIGHSHQPVVFIRGRDRVEWTISDSVSLSPGERYIVNVGSIGQPRDGDPRASFCIFDADKGEIEIIRSEYDIAAAQKAIRQADLPEILAERLGYGR